MGLCEEHCMKSLDYGNIKGFQDVYRTPFLAPRDLPDFSLKFFLDFVGGISMVLTFLRNCCGVWRKHGTPREAQGAGSNVNKVESFACDEWGGCLHSCACLF